MTIKELKEKLSNIDFATGTKKVALGIALTSVIGVSLTATAHAAIPASNILGDAYITFSCGSVANGIKEQLSNALCRVLVI